MLSMIKTRLSNIKPFSKEIVGFYN